MKLQRIKGVLTKIGWMSKRLIKIAKELNVGTGTIVDFLNANGFDVANKPTTKVTPEMEEVLLKEFAKDREIKEQADQRVIGIRHDSPKEEPEEKPTPKLAPKPIAESKPKPEPKLEPTPKPEEPEKEATAKKEEEKPPEEKAKVGLRGTKVLGKIDLDKYAKPSKKEPAKKEPAENSKEEPTKKVDAPKADPVKEQPAVVSNKTEDSKPPVEDAKPPKVEQPKAEQPPKDDPKKELPKKEEAKKETPKQETPKKEATKEQPPKEEPKQEPVVEVKKEIQPPAEEPKKPAPKPEDEYIKASAPKLKGVKILGKISLEKPKSKKPPVKDTKEAPKRQKRKRKKIVKADEKPREQREQRPATNRPRPTRGPATPNKSRSKEEVKEVSKKEIEEKIKATMARMSGSGKKKRQRQRREHRENVREKQEQREIESVTGKLQLTEFISVSELAGLMDVPVTEVITTCMNLGVIVGINQRLEADVIELVAGEYGHEIEFISVEESADVDLEEVEDDPTDLQPRAPIITVMGHVDHGKTSLLDFIRRANVASGEAGGITQHIGAYEVVTKEGKKLTFLDTPGHEAFTAMRARGAKVTDIAIIIVAADDSVMPQTKEAISHAQAAEVPIIFAINKIDKEGAAPERIKQELANMNLLVEEWGGKYQSQDISAKAGTNIEELLEKVLLEAELLELNANPKRLAVGTILEASLEKGRGYTAKVLVQNGTLSIGDNIVAGEHYGKVKAMFNERGVRVKDVGPSTPVLILGLSGAPQAGEIFKETEREQDAKAISSKRSQIAREQTNRANKRISLDEISRRLALGSFKELNLIVKGDFDGSVEALSDSLIKLSQDTVKVNVIHKAVGQIIESDILLASASDAIVIGFQVRPSANARKLAEQEGVQIKTYSIIYEAIEEISSAIEGMLEPTREERIIGNLEVRDTFKVSKVGTIAGCFVTEGKILRNSYIRVIRDGIVIFPAKANTIGELSSLKRYKDDVKEVRSGMECGLAVKNFNDIQVGDVVESYEIIEIKQKMNL